MNSSGDSYINATVTVEACSLLPAGPRRLELFSITACHCASLSDSWRPHLSFSWAANLSRQVTPVVEQHSRGL